jgi:hypothetical protein
MDDEISPIMNPSSPKRDGLHPIYGVYIGGSPLDDTYKQKSKITYSYALQRCNVKTISSIERNLIIIRNSTVTLKFDGQLEATTGSTVEIGKERFVALLKRRVEEHGQETFYHVQSSTGTVLNLFEHSHFYKLDAVVTEFERSLNAPGQTFFEHFDSFEIDEVTLSRLVVESFLTSAFYEKITI